MNSNFGEWYRNVSLSTDSETLKKRWIGVSGMSVARDDVLNLVRLSFSEEPPPAFVEKFRAGFRQADPEFPVQGNDAELQLLASAVLIDLWGKNRDQAERTEMLAAVGCVATDLGGMRRKQCANAELIRQAYDYLKNEAASRADWKILDTDEEATPDDLKALLAVTAEETNVLWWLFGERSRDLNKAFKALPVETLAFVAGKELSDLTRVLPGAVSVSAIIARVLSLGKGKAENEIDLVEFAKSAPNEWDAASTGLPGGCEIISPIRSMVRAARNGSGADRSRHQLGLKKGAKVAPAVMALQVYWEFQWERAWKRN